VFQLSILDKAFEVDKSAIDAALNRFNMKLLKMELIDEEWYSNRDLHGIKHNERSIPDYLKVFFRHRGGNSDWLEQEMNITDLSRVSVIGIRDSDW